MQANRRIVYSTDFLPKVWQKILSYILSMKIRTRPRFFRPNQLGSDMINSTFETTLHFGRSTPPKRFNLIVSNDKVFMYFIQTIKFGTWQVRRLKRALVSTTMYRTLVVRFETLRLRPYQCSS